MKKRVCLLCALFLIATMALTVSAGTVGETSTASYATVAPVIDGKIDAIWGFTSKQVLESTGNDQGVTGGYTQILWDKTGYYFLAVVEDVTLTEDDWAARNSVDLWVSEQNTQANDYYGDPGDWHFCKASDGTELYYTGNPEVYEVAKSAVTTSATGYVVELYVPHLADTAPDYGYTIGYTVSFNDDVNNDSERDNYTFWSVTEDSDAYWEKPLALPAIELVDGPDQAQLDGTTATEAPATEAPATEAPATEAPATEAPSEVVDQAPQTLDAGVIAAAVAVLSAVGYTVSKKK